jgi:hypothetical protein
VPRQSALIARVRTQKLPTLKVPTAKLGEPELIGLLDEAVQEYQKVRPARLTTDYTGDGTTRDFALPATWVTGFSAAVAVEFPVDQVVPVFLDSAAWGLVPLGAPTMLRVLTTVPGVGQVMRFYSTGPQAYGPLDTQVTVPATDDEILCNIVARLACMALAAAFAEVKDPLIAADGLDYRDISRRYLDLAEYFGKLLPVEFQTSVESDASASASAGTPGLQPAGAWINWNTMAQYGRPYLWHGVGR